MLRHIGSVCKIDGVTVNEEAYKKQTISSFDSDTKIWDVGNVIGGVYGSYTALKLAIPSDLTFPATIKVTAKRYHEFNSRNCKRNSKL